MIWGETQGCCAGIIGDVGTKKREEGGIDAGGGRIEGWT